MESKKYTVAIDLGESNVVVVVGSKDPRGQIAIDGIVSRPCEGVKGGMIDNIALVEESIKNAVIEIEQRLNIRILETYAGISGEFVRFACHSDHVYVTDPQNGVGQNDVDALYERMRHVQAPDNETIMERIPQNYVVDEAKEVKNPVGSFGRRLSSTFNFILCGNTPMQRLENALRRLGITMIKSYPNALAVADSVLTPDEKEEGVVVVNIGGGLTDLTIYYRNVVRYIISIPMGATAINQDIRSMMIPDKYIEKLKCDYGSAVADMVPENKAVRVNGRTPRESRDILLYNLAVAIEARMSMLVDFIKREIKDSGYEDRLPYGIVVTGGSANLKNIDELFRRMTDMEVRVGKPMEGINDDSLDLIDNPQYSTAVGILIRGMAQGHCATGSINAPDIEEVEEIASSQTERGTQLSGRGYTPPAERGYTPPSSTSTSPSTPPPVVVPPVQKPPQKVVVPPPAHSAYTQPGATQQPRVTAQPGAAQQYGAPVANTSDFLPPTDHTTPTKSTSPQSIPMSDYLYQRGGLDVVEDMGESKEEPSRPIKEGVNRIEEQPAKEKTRNWKDVFKRAIDKLNDGFNAADDEEI